MNISGSPPDARLLTGRDSGPLEEVEPGQRLLPEVAHAFRSLRDAAAAQGLELAIASAHRDYQRQLVIFNGKVTGKRSIHDDSGGVLNTAALSMDQLLHAILRYSALPGASRHHWGTDLDVFDAGALKADERVALEPAEVAPGGPFAPLHEWLDDCMARGESFGFYRPYTGNYCSVAPERWHLSYAPLALPFAEALSEQLLLDCWCEDEPPALRDRLEQRLPDLFDRYVRVRRGWCPVL